MNNKLNLIAPKGLKFSDEVINKAIHFESLTKEERKNENNKEILEQLKNEFNNLKEQFNSIITKELETLKTNHFNTLKEVEEEHSNGLKKLEEQFKNGDVKEEDYKNGIKGLKFVAKRSKNKENKNYDAAIKETKQQIESLYFDYELLAKTLKGQKGCPSIMLNRKMDVFKRTFSFKSFITNKNMWFNMIPTIMLILLVISFFIAKKITGYGGDLTNVINNGVFISVVATGAVFIYSSGSFDMSLGPASLMCATIAGILWNSTHNIYISFLVAIALGALLGIVNAVLANVLDLPVMVMTLTMMNILNAIHAVILQTVGNQLFIDGGMVSGDKIMGIDTATIVYAGFLITFFLLLWSIFNYTKIGRRNKFIGSNQTAAKYNGISLMKAGIISFAISGIGLGLCGFLFAMSKSGSSYSTGTILDTIGLNVVIAIVFGGMTTSGGPRSRVSCAVVGAFFCIFLDELFRAIGIADYRYIAKGIIFLVVSFANMYNSRPKMLAR